MPSDNLTVWEPNEEDWRRARTSLDYTLSPTVPRSVAIELQAYVFARNRQLRSEHERAERAEAEIISLRNS